MFIGNVKIKSIATLAPMAGVTDRAFREICSMFGASAVTTEMVSVKGLIYNDKKTLALTDHQKNGSVFIIQLFGKDPQDFEKAAPIVSKFSPDIIDINMGCPAPKIVRSGGGSYLMKNPKLCGEIVHAVKSNCNLPVTIKIRAGVDNNEKNAPDVALECQKYGACAVTVHGRTREQMYSGENDLDIIKNVVETVNIPVIGNGDITSREKALFMLDYTGCQAIAIGRAALGNPWIFKDINGEKSLSYVSLAEKVDIIKKHIEKIILYKGKDIGFKEARKHLAWYVKGFSGAAMLRKQIFSMKNYSDFENICRILIDKNGKNSI